MNRLRVGMVLMVSAGGLILSGCEKPVFPPSAQRTPYERYQVLRGEYRPPTETNAFGGEQPALRDRLTPLYSR